jgi:hypothetical protein
LGSPIGVALVLLAPLIMEAPFLAFVAFAISDVIVFFIRVVWAFGLDGAI